MRETKIQFSQAEMELLCNREIILTKNKALGKIKELLENLQHNVQSYIERNRSLAQHDIFTNHPKISKGENYLGLPYLILDYPRCFQNQDIFTIRTMFWWGNFYSSTLHLAGKFKTEFMHKIQYAFVFLSNADYYISVNQDSWAHHFEEDNYKKLNALSVQEFIHACNQHQHLKLANNIPVNSNGLEEKLLNNWKELVKICFD